LKKSIAIHSYKGGTGKSSVAANLAVAYAKQGSDVCLLDYDFRAPSLHVLFKVKPQHWLNEFLEGNCKIEEATVDATQRYGTKGKLLIGLANPSSDSMREMMSKDRKWEMKALHKTLSAKKTIFNDLDMNHLIFDTGPGMYYSSINALASSDVVALVMKMDKFDIEGTKEMIKGIYKALGRKTGILLNKIPAQQISSEGGPEKMATLVESIFELPLIGTIPCFCELMATGGRMIYTHEEPQHAFSQAILRIAKKLEQF